MIARPAIGAKEARLQELIDELEDRILELAQEDRRAAERPQMDGQAVMAYLRIDGGPLVGRALKHLLEVKRAEGELSSAEVEARLDQWWEVNRPAGS